MSSINNNSQTVMFVYQTASASILASRTVTGQSTILSMAPDGSRFMAGFTLYDTSTLGVIAQQNANNLPFPLSSTTTATFNVVAECGRQRFFARWDHALQRLQLGPVVHARDLGASINAAGFDDPTIWRRALGIKLPESIIAKMVILSDASQAWGLSQSGLIHMPLGNSTSIRSCSRRRPTYSFRTTAAAAAERRRRCRSLISAKAS